MLSQLPQGRADRHDSMGTSLDRAALLERSAASPFRVVLLNMQEHLREQLDLSEAMTTRLVRMIDQAHALQALIMHALHQKTEADRVAVREQDAAQALAQLPAPAATAATPALQLPAPPPSMSLGWQLSAIAQSPLLSPPAVSSVSAPSGPLALAPSTSLPSPLRKRQSLRPCQPLPKIRVVRHQHQHQLEHHDRQQHQHEPLSATAGPAGSRPPVNGGVCAPSGTGAGSGPGPGTGTGIRLDPGIGQLAFASPLSTARTPAVADPAVATVVPSVATVATVVGAQSVTGDSAGQKGAWAAVARSASWRSSPREGCVEGGPCQPQQLSSPKKQPQRQKPRYDPSCHPKPAIPAAVPQPLRDAKAAGAQLAGAACSSHQDLATELSPGGAASSVFDGGRSPVSFFADGPIAAATPTHNHAMPSPCPCLPAACTSGGGGGDGGTTLEAMGSFVRPHVARVLQFQPPPPPLPPPPWSLAPAEPRPPVVMTPYEEDLGSFGRGDAPLEAHVKRRRTTSGGPWSGCIVEGVVQSPFGIDSAAAAAAAAAPPVSFHWPLHQGAPAPLAQCERGQSYHWLVPANQQQQHYQHQVLH